MARAYFDQNPFGAAPIEPGLDVIRRVYSQRAPTPMASLSKAIQEPFVTDVIVPGISRIRDEMRIAEQEERIAAQAEAKRAAAAQALQQAAAAEQQGLDAEIAAAVSGVDVPMVSGGGEYSTPLSKLATGLRKITTPAGMHEDMRSRYIEGFDTALDLREAVYDAVGEEIAGPFDFKGEPSLRAAMMLERELAAIRRGPSASGARKGGGSLEKAKRIAKGLRDRGLGDIVAEIVQGATAEEAFMAAGRQLQQTQQRRGEQEAAAAATQRFERALAGELPQVAAEQAMVPTMRDGRPVLLSQYDDSAQEQIDRQAVRRFRQTGELPAPPDQAAQPQAIQRPESIEQANRLREQAAALEEEAKGIEATPVYRTFGDHAMAFLDALDSGDVATQMALMESVGGSTDYQPFGKGAVGKAIGKDASMRARRDLLDLKKKYLDAKRREDSAMKLVEKKAELRGKKTRTGGRVGSGYGRKDKVLMNALVALNRGDSLTDAQKKALKATGKLTQAEIESLTPDRPAAWQVLRTNMRGRRARADAKSIMSGQPTPEEIEVRKAAADEKAEQNAIKKLEAEVRLATGEEKKRKQEELERRRIDAKIGSAATRLDTAATDLVKAEFAVEASLREQDQLLKAIGKETDETKKANLQAQLANAKAREEAQERIRATQEAKKNRLQKELDALKAQRRAMPAKANP